MSIWIPCIVLTAALLVGIPLADYLGVPPVVAASAATVNAASAITVLVMLGLQAPVFAEPGWPGWSCSARPGMMALVGAVAALFTPRRRAASVGRCVYCDLPLYADHTGRRYFADGAGFLCPPKHRQPDRQRHSLAVVGHRHPAPAPDAVPDADGWR